jgi:Acetyltransferases, including N-acetylases of ribosomal proteins
MFSLKVDDELELALPTEKCADEAFAVVMENYEHLHEWLSWVNENFSRESVREFYKLSLMRLAAGGDEIGLNIVYRGRIVGGIGFHEINWRDKSAEIGYWLAKSETGKGLATRSVVRLIEYGFTELELHRIVIKCVPENLKSRAIPEKLGFTREGVEREAGWLHTRFVDHVVYSMLEHEWREKNKK